MKRIALLLGLVLALGCGGSGLLVDNSPVVRLVNAWGGKTVNGNVGGITILPNAAFAGAGVARIDEGTHSIVFLDANATALTNDPHVFEDGKDYTIILSPFGLIKLQQAFTPAVGNAAIRIANAAGVLQPRIDIFTADPGESFANATLYQDNLDNGTATSFRDIVAGTRKFFITEETGTTVLYEGEHTFAEGKHYTVIIGANSTIHFITLTED